jgi:hypothetical protein
MLKRKHLVEMRAIVRRGWMLGLLTSIACAAGTQHPRPPGERQETDARPMLLRELQQQARSWGPFDSMRVSFSSVPSSRAGILYHWGIYHPAQSMHSRPTVVVVENRGRALLIRTANDWFGATGKILPSTSAEALIACAEAIHTTAEPRLPRAKPRVYDGPEVLEGIELQDSAWAELIERIHTPVVERQGTAGWISQLWTVDFLAAKRYECTIDPDRMSLIATDSVDAIDARH